MNWILAFAAFMFGFVAGYLVMYVVFWLPQNLEMHRLLGIISAPPERNR